MKTRTAHGWGGVSHGVPIHTIAPASAGELRQVFAGGEHGSCLGRGLGRSYGDCALTSGGTLIDCRFLDHFLSFDPENGILECEAGVTIYDINRLFIASGWMLPVSPGTQFVTIGGAISNDIHGKNHVRESSFGAHLIAFKLVRSDGEVLECSTGNNASLFAATIGGIGLTGLIVSAKIQLRPIRSLMMNSKRARFDSLAELFGLASENSGAWEYQIAWMDPAAGCRTGFYMTANHSDQPGELQWPEHRRLSPGILGSLPTDLPGRLLMKTANFVYRTGFSIGSQHQSVESVLYPLDRMPDWNLLFGKTGFFQYQCVFPETVAESAVDDLLKVIGDNRHMVTLAVGKWFGSRLSPGLLSFPLPGFSIALDIANKGAATHRLLDSLDDVVASFEGRLYPAKDGRMPSALFAGGYPELELFEQHIDPKMASDFWRRMEQSA